MRISHFKGLIKEHDRVNVVEIVKITSFFSSFVGEEANKILVEEVSKEELKVVLVLIPRQSPMLSIKFLINT